MNIKKFQKEAISVQLHSGKQEDNFIKPQIHPKNANNIANLFGSYKTIAKELNRGGFKNCKERSMYDHNFSRGPKNKNNSNCNSLLLDEKKGQGHPKSPKRQSKEKKGREVLISSHIKNNSSACLNNHKVESKFNHVVKILNEQKDKQTVNCPDYISTEISNLSKTEVLLTEHSGINKSMKSRIVMVNTDAFQNCKKNCEPLNKVNLCSTTNCNENSEKINMTDTSTNIKKKDAVLERIRAKLHKAEYQNSKNISPDKHEKETVINIQHNVNHNINHNIQININHYNSRSSLISPLDPAGRDLKEGICKKIESSINENVVKTAFSFKSIFDNFNKRMMKNIGPKPSISFKKLKLPSKNCQRQKESELSSVSGINFHVSEETKIEYENLYNKTEALHTPESQVGRKLKNELMKAKLKDSLKNTPNKKEPSNCVSEQCFDDILKKTISISKGGKTNAHSSGGSLISEESIFSNKKTKSKNNTNNNSSLKQLSQSLKLSSLSSSNHEKKNSYSMEKSNSNKDLEATLSYTLSDDEVTGRVSKRSIVIHGNKIDAEDFQNFYKEMNRKLFKYK